MANKSLTAYVSADICSRESLFGDGFYSQRLKISRFKYDSLDSPNLVIVLEKPDGQNYPYIFISEDVIRQFLCDMEIYNIYYDKVSDMKELLGKNVEVFFSPKHNLPIAVSPIFPQTTRKLIEDRKLENLLNDTDCDKDLYGGSDED